MNFDIQFYNSSMDIPFTKEFRNGSLQIFTQPSGWDKPMEDAIVTVSLEDQLLAIFLSDGMGGHAGGARAVECMHESVCKTFHSQALNSKIRELVMDAIELSDESIKNLKVGAGATIVAFEIGNDFARSFHAGDSISYIIGPRGKIKYFSTEHSPRGHAIESGLVHADNVDKYIKEDHEVSNGLGFLPMTLEVSQKIELNNQDLLFLSSDNVPKNYNEKQIIEFITSGEFEKRMEIIKATMLTNFEETKKDDTSIALFKYKGSISNKP